MSRTPSSRSSLNLYLIGRILRIHSLLRGVRAYFAPLRLPGPLCLPFFFWAAWCVELYSRIFGTQAPITRDFIRIGMVPYAMDTSRMRAELLAKLSYPTLADGMVEM